MRFANQMGSVFLSEPRFHLLNKNLNPQLCFRNIAILSQEGQDEGQARFQTILRRG